MKERPILFTPANALKCHDGTKTQTRRIIKNQPGKFVHIEYDERKGWQYWWDVGVSGMPDVSQEYAPLKCPYGEPGDRLWVREAWRMSGEYADVSTTKIKPDDAWLYTDHLRYRGEQHSEGVDKWRSSMMMPRWACRTVLEITEVRVQRLQACSEADAIAEGIERIGGAASCNPWRNYRIGKPGEMSMHCSCPIRSYMTLWESINGAGSWAENPWVWCVSFKKV